MRTSEGSTGSQLRARWCLHCWLRLLQHWSKGGWFLYHFFGASSFRHWGQGRWYRRNWLQLWSNRAVGAGLRAIGLGYGEMGARNEAMGAGLGEIGFSYRALGARLRAIGFDSGQMIKRNCGYGF